MSLQVRKIDSMRWRIGARCGPAPWLVFAAGAHDLGGEVGELVFEVLAAEVLIADQDQHLAGCSLAALDEL